MEFLPDELDFGSLEELDFAPSDELDVSLTEELDDLASLLEDVTLEEDFASLLLAAGCCALLCAFQLAPLLTYLRQGVGAAGLQMNAGYFALAPAQLLLWGEGDLPVDPRDLTLSGMPLELGFHVVLGCVLCVLCLARRPKDSASRAALFCLLTGLATAFMSTTFFPWSQAAVLTRGFINYIQFAWRLLMFPSVFLALAAGYGYVRFIEDRSFCLVTVLALSILMILPTVNRQTRFNDYLEPGQITSPHMLYEEYTLPGTVPHPPLLQLPGGGQRKPDPSPVCI